MKNIGLRFAAVLFMVLGSLAVARAQTPAPPTAPTQAPHLVYRYDTRPPYTADGTGIFQVGFTRPTWGYHSIAYHVRSVPGTASESALISTSSSFGYVQLFALSWNEPGTTYYIYTIVPGENFVDVAGTYARTVNEMEPGPLRDRLTGTRQIFTQESEYAAIERIGPDRILNAREYIDVGGTTTPTNPMIIFNEYANLNLTPEIHPNTYPLDNARGGFFAVPLPPLPPNATDPTPDPPIQVTEGFVCDFTLASYIGGSPSERGKRSTDSAEAASSNPCADVIEDEIATIPLNTPAGYATNGTITDNVAFGDFRQWVDVTGDGQTDLCVVYVSSSTVTCFKNDHGTFSTKLLSKVVNDTGYKDSMAFVNVTGNPGEIAFCRLVGFWISSANVQCDNFVKDKDQMLPSQVLTSDPLDGGYSGSRWWVDVNGDGKADYCRTVNHGGTKVYCTESTGTGFGQTASTRVIDLGWDDGSRQWADVKGDGTKAYCRLVGTYTQLQCSVVNKTTGLFDEEISSGTVDAGWEGNRWWADVNGDGKADFCRIVGASSLRMSCILSTGNGFGTTVLLPSIDLGWEDTRAMVDINGDGYADFCRLTSNYTVMSCLINDHLSFVTSTDSSSSSVDSGWGTVAEQTRHWLPGTGRQTGMYCRSADSNAVKCDQIF